MQKKWILVASILINAVVCLVLSKQKGLSISAIRVDVRELHVM